MTDSIESEIRRGPGRPRLNPSPVETPEASEPIVAAPRQRMRKGGQAKDKFAVPDPLKLEGTSYEWKTATVMGKPFHDHMIEMREQGWLPVDDRRMREHFMPPGHVGAIERDGLVLMERPQELTDEARREDHANARLAVYTKEQQLHEAGPGQFERSNKGAPMGSVHRSIERGAMPVE